MKTFSTNDKKFGFKPKADKSVKTSRSNARTDKEVGEHCSNTASRSKVQSLYLATSYILITFYVKFLALHMISSVYL